MARLISLRYGATCVDCGKDLAPGTKARWFGRGRVSCCGGEHTATSTVSGSRVQPADDQPLDGEVYSLAGIGEGLLREYFINESKTLRAADLTTEQFAELLSTMFYRALFLENPEQSQLKYTHNLAKMVRAH